MFICMHPKYAMANESVGTVPKGYMRAGKLKDAVSHFSHYAYATRAASSVGCHAPSRKHRRRLATLSIV